MRYCSSLHQSPHPASLGKSSVLPPHGGFAQGALVGGGIDRAAASPSFASSSVGIALFTSAGIGLEPDGGNLVGGKATRGPAGCRLAQGAAVPTAASARLGLGGALRVHGTSAPVPGTLVAWFAYGA